MFGIVAAPQAVTTRVGSKACAAIAWSRPPVRGLATTRVLATRWSAAAGTLPCTHSDGAPQAAMAAWGAPSLWVHGNVPAAADHRVAKTRVVANPRTGGRDHAMAAHAFDPTLVVTA